MVGVAIFTLILVYLCIRFGGLFMAMVIGAFWSFGVTSVAAIMFLRPEYGVEHFLWFYLYAPTYWTFGIAFVLGTLMSAGFFKQQGWGK